MANNPETNDRVQKYCQSLQYKDSRRLEPDEHRRLGALRLELAHRAKSGKWQFPLMILFVIALVVALRLFGIIIAALVMGVWYPKYKTAKEFTKMMDTGALEPVVDRFVSVDGSSIEGLFVNEKPRLHKKPPFLANELEVLASRFVWSVNSNPVPTTIAVVREVAAPPPEVDINIERMRSQGVSEPIERSLTAVEAQELLWHHRSIKSQSVLLRWLKLGGFFSIILLAIGAVSSFSDNKMDGIMVFGIIAAIVFFVFALAGWSMDRGIFGDYLRLRKDVAELNVKLIEHPHPQYKGRLVEVLSKSGALWTVDGVPARWRSQV